MPNYAVAAVTQCLLLQVYTVPVEMSLQNICRVTILSHVPITKVHLLPLPKPLQNYLQFKRNLHYFNRQ